MLAKSPAYIISDKIWLTTERFKGSPPYLSNTNTIKLNMFENVNVSKHRKTARTFISMVIIVEFYSEAGKNQWIFTSKRTKRILR